MTSLFTIIYCWFETLFGVNVAEHMRGWSDQTQDYTNPNHFIMIGSVTLVISLVVAVLFYYVINHPRFNRIWSWLLMLVFQAVIALLVGYFFLRDQILSGQIADSLMYERDDSGEIVATLINSGWSLGFANFFVSIIFFVVISICIKWWSCNCKKCPF